MSLVWIVYIIETLLPAFSLHGGVLVAFALISGSGFLVGLGIINDVVSRDKEGHYYNTLQSFYKTWVLRSFLFLFLPW